MTDKKAQIGFRLSPEIAQALEEKLKADGITPTVLYRMLTQLYLLEFLRYQDIVDFVSGEKDLRREEGDV